MDLGCIDMGCLEKEKTPKESTASASKLGKNKAKDVIRSSSNALNKLTSQISKPPRRKTSPLNWFPRKKVEPYLKRKIKMLQEVDGGMHLTLDETLGDSNPHYSKVLREKIAIREAAEKAMEARKAAMVEASWLRILQAAGIESKEAEEQLSKAQLSADEAFEAARAVGVIMNDMPTSAQNHYKIEVTSGSTTHTVSATFETAFAVDKQVAAAVKAAFVKLANCHSINKEEFKELLHKISENPDVDDLSEITSECDSDTGSDMEARSCNDSLKMLKRPESDKLNTTNIINMMLGRLQCLKEDELASLATIVATSGLNAALAETENSKQHPLNSSVQSTENPCPKVSRKTSVCGRTAKNARGVADVEIPSLDQFLVKRLTRLEREVLEAKNARKNEASDGSKRIDEDSWSKVKIKDGGTTIPDLGSVLKKHSSNLEKEIEEARMNGRSSEVDNKKFQSRGKQDTVDVPSLDKYLVKRLSRLEKEVQEARNRNKLGPTEKPMVNCLAEAKSSENSTSEDSEGKENLDVNKIENRNAGKNSSHEDTEVVSLEDQKRKRKEAQADSESDLLLHREEREEESSQNSVRVQKLQRKDEQNGAHYESLDKVLVKHVSRLEKEKLKFCADEKMQIKSKRKDTVRELESAEGSLEQVLVKHKSKLEREKLAAVEQQEPDSTRHSVSRREARERELQAAWGGMSLGNSMRPHVSRLQRDKAAWLEADEEEKRAAMEGVPCEVQSS